MRITALTPTAIGCAGESRWAAGSYSIAARKDLKGMDLACDCPITGDSGERFPCHGDVLLYVANNEKMPAGLSPLAAADYAHNEDSK